MIYVTGYGYRVPDGHVSINTTSRSTNWTKGFSPFVLEAGHLYEDFYAKTVENGWQYTKVYEEHLNPDGSINFQKYFKWAQRGWKSTYADRYPMGKDAKPMFNYWDGEKMPYLTAKKNIYYPLYARAVEACDEFKGLVELAELCKKEGVDIYLHDFDGYNHIKEGLSFEDVLNNPNRKMGHAFIIWDLLDRKYNLAK